MGENVLSGLLPGGSSSLLHFSEQQFDEKWAKAEVVVADLIAAIQPSRHSEDKRRAVIEYVERLIRKNFNYQVCTFGSVPLKTYLPDGDIDFTTFSCFPHSSEAWANDLRHVLKREEHNKHAKFCVKEVQIIHAEVQLVKCLVDNIIVDISFNQLGGLCTLCFLEEVDRLIGKDHLFKRSIILVKAWCYYESRILGAHHGLISTYALETLVLYIFNIFHTSLHGPFEVLYMFLQFFSQFDWKHYCLSLWGPIRLSALHEMIAEPPHMDAIELLFSHEFLMRCSHVYGVLWFGAPDFQGRDFVSKNMNIVDPLKFNNNLGRSVNRSNFFRICRAFAYGAKQIEKLLNGPLQELAEKLDEVFRNTKQHCRGYHLDAPSTGPLVNILDPATTSMLEGSEEASHYANHPCVSNDSRQSLLSEASETGNGCSTSIDSSSIDVASKPLFEGSSSLHKITIEWGANLGNGGDSGSREDECTVDLSSRGEASGRVSELSSNGTDERLKECNGVTTASERTVYGRGAFKNAGDSSNSGNGSNECNTGAAVKGQQAHSSPAMLVNHQLNDALPSVSNMRCKQPAHQTRDAATPVILTGDFESYLFSLQACRLMVMSQFYSPIAFQVPVMFPPGPMYEQPFASGGPGRPPMDGDLNTFAQAFSYNYEEYLNPAFQRLSLQNAFTLAANGAFSGDTWKSHRGTGTYLPNLRSGTGNPSPVNRDGRTNVRPPKLSECNGFASHNNGGSHTTRHRYGGKDFQEDGHKLHEDKVPEFVANNVNGVGTSVLLSSQAPGLNLSAVGNGKHAEGSCLYTPSVSQAGAMFHHPHGNNGHIQSTESLQFGSFGSALLAGQKKAPVHADARKDPDEVRIEQHVTARKVLFNDSSPQSSLLKLPYELKEEDFPPLSTSGQHHQTKASMFPTPLVESGVTGGWPHFPAGSTNHQSWSVLKSKHHVDT